jgi:Galactose-3-O-sulfotransferase
MMLLLKKFKMKWAYRRKTTSSLIAVIIFFLGLLRLWQEEWITLADEDDVFSKTEQPWNSDWWKPLVDEISRPFAPLPKDQSWCVPRPIVQDEHAFNATSKAGLYLVKIPKTASSTAAGVTIQIARNVMARNKHPTMECTHHVEHGQAHVDREDPFFLWTVVRHPVKRAVSHYFFMTVSRLQVNATSEGMMTQLQQYKNLQFRQLARRRVNYDDSNNTTSVEIRYPLDALETTTENIMEMIKRDILDKFHFIGVSERLDESLVVLKMLLQLEMPDVVVLSSKVNGGLDAGGLHGICVRIQPAFTTPEVDQYLAQEFSVRNFDFLLHAVANRSLDLTIDALGRDRFQTELQTYHAMKRYAQDQCQNTTVYPCVEAGQTPNTETSCFVGDLGCGHLCVQQVLHNFSD